MTRDLTPAEWLSGILLGAASVVTVPDRPKAQGTITSPNGNVYQVMQKLGTTDRYNLYICQLPNGRYGVLKIAATEAQNTLLQQEVVMLRLMAAKAEEVESKRPAGERPYNYQYFFPAIIESFISEGQGNRQVTILGFPEEVETLTQLTPVSYLIEKEHVRVDPKTMAWILGKTLKVLAFAHEQGIANRLVAGSNILIEREQHGVVVFDWTLAQLYPDDTVPPAVCREEFANAARMAIAILGGNPEKGEIPPDPQLTDDRLERFMWRLASQIDTADVFQAHDFFYALIESMWGRKFHPFTTSPL